MFHVKHLLLVLLIVSCDRILHESSVLEEAQEDQFLRIHNKARRSVGLEDLTWNVALHLHARSWANYLAKGCQVRPSEGSGYDENILQDWSHRSTHNIVYTWALSPEHQRSILNPHVKSIGCATASCIDSLTHQISRIHVCNYFPGHKL